MNNKLVSSHEEWKPIEETTGKYSVSSMGRIKNNLTGSVLKPIKMRKGYVKVNLHLDYGERITKQIHRLVAIAFIPNPENKPEVNHKNGIKNDNRVVNLEWVTGEENRKHAYDTGLQRHKDSRHDGYLYRLWIRHHKDNMCTEWQDYLKFHKWCYDNGYSDGFYVGKHRIDREYNPNNCFISNTIQRGFKMYSCYGEELSIEAISKKYNVKQQTLMYRIGQGMTMEEAVTKKKGKAVDSMLKLRMSRKLYEHVFFEAEKNDMTASAYVRTLIDKDIKAKQLKNQLQEFDNLPFS